MRSNEGIPRYTLGIPQGIAIFSEEVEVVPRRRGQIIISLQPGHRFPRSRRRWKALSVLDVAALFLFLKAFTDTHLGKWYGLLSPDF